MTSFQGQGDEGGSLPWGGSDAFVGAGRLAGLANDLLGDDVFVLVDDQQAPVDHQDADHGADSRDVVGVDALDLADRGAGVAEG